VQRVTLLILSALWVYVSPFPRVMEWVFRCLGSSFPFSCSTCNFLLGFQIPLSGMFFLFAWACLVSNQGGAWCSTKEERVRDIGHVTECTSLSQGYLPLGQNGGGRREGGEGSCIIETTATLKTMKPEKQLSWVLCCRVYKKCLTSLAML